MPYKGVIIMEKQKTYEIFTDASYDNVTKLGTYAIVIMQENKIVKIIAKKCNVQLENSTECEVFAIFQAINFIQGSLLKKNIIQKFWLRTDCVVARDFFIEDENKIKVFEHNLTLLDTIKQTYERIKKALSKKDCSFRIKWIPREINKLAHKHSYSTFQKLKIQNNKNDIILIDKDLFLELLQILNSNYYKVISYLFQNSNEEKLILKTQNKIAQTLELSTHNINKIFKQLIKLNILGKVKNGKYILLI